MSAISITRTDRSRIQEVDFANLEFGKHLSDHMLISVYENERWGAPTIVPFGDLSFSPAMLAIHYGQAIFEGMKAFRRPDGDITIFRPERHHQRFLKSLDRMCMPAIPKEIFIDGLAELVKVDQQWCPGTHESSLYLRPLAFASEARLGVKIADRYHFIIMTSPVGKYQAKPYRLRVETEYTRTVEGGTGFAKCAGNYGGAYYPTRLAVRQGYDQVLWTDGREHLYIDEVGMMNVMFVIDGVLVTPALNSAILDGITRDSILTIARDMGMEVEERKIAVAELEDAFRTGRITEAFGTGTAAVASSIATINIGGIDHSVPEPTEASFQTKAKQELHAIRMGLVPDRHNWNQIIKA